jgi:hypothetical protein
MIAQFQQQRARSTRTANLWAVVGALCVVAAAFLFMIALILFTVYVATDLDADARTSTVHRPFIQVWDSVIPWLTTRRS